MKVLGRRQQLLWMTVMRVSSCLVLLVYISVFLISSASAATPGSSTGISVSRSKSSAPEVYRSAKICIGTNGRMSVPSNRSHHYRNLKDRYTNCTYVEGNLELTWIQDRDMDLSFLQHIREVTGYVLISHVDVKRIVLPSLQVIRGRTLFRLNVHDDEFALMVTLSRMDNLELPALRDVLNGNVGIFNNYNLCHVKTINWDEIISGVKSRYVYVYNYTQPERECPPCDPSCEAGCWGEGAHNCQKFSKINCSPQCHEGRCYGPEPRQCCHLSCAGGCTGPKKSDCLACKKFYDDGECKDECPSLVIYNPNTYLSERNPDGKYAYGATCVKTCPDHLLRDAGAGACVRQCPRDKEARDGECVPCNGPCRKKCQGPANAIIHSGNIESFRNCTIIEGNIAILETSFNGFQEVHQNFTFGDRYAPMEPSKLEVFSTLKEVTGYINIQATHPNFTNLSYFRNLEIIGGRDKADYFSSLYIVKTSLHALHLRSLKKIRSGAVTILENEKLCYAHQINWSKIKSEKADVQIYNNKPATDCEKTGEVCSSQCSKDGCWGLEPRDCLACAKFKLDDNCVPSCNSTIGTYEDAFGLCKHCHDQCDTTCHGAGPGNCTRCKNVQDGPFCVEACPERKYNVGGDCHKCHENCLGGCTGPANTIGFSGCNSCHQAIVHETDGVMTIERCLGKDDTCPTGYYYDTVSPKETGTLKPLAGKSVCKKCHPKCKQCTSFGFHIHVCQECSHYKKGEQCEDECPAEFYADEEIRECLPCADECRSCVGPSAANCDNCRNFRIYPDGDAGNEVNSSFICTMHCPPEYPHRIVENENEPFCARNPPVSLGMGDQNTRSAVILTSVLCVFVFSIFAVIVGVYCFKTKTKTNEMKLALAMTGLEDNEPLRPTNVKPNLKKFRAVKEEELRISHKLGNGAFGEVFSGIWIPEGQNVKVPVAIKVLKNGTVTGSKEFLEEAYIMASVDHPHLLSLLAVCMSTSNLMLVTRLMALGCLRDFVEKYNGKIGSKVMLNWCTQIAKGMEYLESKRLVHRDLAARNVLVHKDMKTKELTVRITDFGLAKLLDGDDDEYKADGGKLPIKWLAIECIKDYIFTHKSDVWAFGVTVWELLTFGGKPYKDVAAQELLPLLQTGKRLPHPPKCSLELYMVLVQTWMPNPEARPSFQELVKEFTKMSQEPSKFLTIGDMRLPPFEKEDYSELLKDLATGMDGPEIIMDADEYLQPRSNGTTTNSSASTNGTLKRGAVGGIGNSTTGGMYSQEENWPESPQNFHSRYRHRQLYGSTGGVGPALSVTDSSRYCSDPLKILGRDTSDGGYSIESVGGKGREAYVGNMKLDLPVDEDDYLMPSPQTNQNASTYLDLVSDSGNHDTGDNNELRRLAMRNSQPHYPTLVDNPEYQLMAREYTNVPLAYAPIGLPLAPTNGSSVSTTSANNPNRYSNSGQTLSTFAHNSNSSSNSSNKSHPHQQQQQQQHPYYHIQNNHQQQQQQQQHQFNRPSSIVRHSSRSEEESDHEYYNEIDRLRREKQPLQQSVRKNETTV